MSKIGRNDPCPCGSGKKYKNCHWAEAQTSSLETQLQSEPIKKSAFEELIENYRTLPIVKLIGVLQLAAVNHGKENSFEEWARLALLQWKENDERPFASWGRLNTVLSNMGFPYDDPTNAFTENAIFSEGNYVVYPGIYVGMTTVLNELTECIFLRENNLPESFKKDVNDGTGLLLLMSDSIAQNKRHTRYMYEKQLSGNSVYIPDHTDAMDDLDTISFSKDFLRKICTIQKYNYEIVNEFILSLGEPELNNDDPDHNPVSKKPLVETADELVLYMPTTVVNSLIEFICRKANEFECYDDVLSLLTNHQFYNTCTALSGMKWVATDISLPEDEFKLPIRERVFQFDNQKFGYLCFIESTRIDTLKHNNDLERRNQQVIQYLQTLTDQQEFQVLTLFVLSETGQQDEVFSWQKPSLNHQVISFVYHEFLALGYAADTDILSLWKFAKTYSRTSEKVRIITPGGILDAYAVYNHNSGSLLHSDEANPEGGIIMIGSGTSNDFQREVQKKRDEHAVLLFNGSVAGYTKVIKEKDFAPIYKDKLVSTEHRIVIENFKMPIWVTNYQSDTNADTSWAHQICEAVAFWFQKVEADVKPLFDDLNLIQFEIEIIVDENLLRAEQFEIKEVDTSTISVEIQIQAPRIKLIIPYEFLYLVQQTNNQADKLLMTAALQGIVDYTEKAGRKIALDETKIKNIVDKALEPASAKMILFSDASSNIRLDSRGLPTLRYIQEADISYVLDNLLSYLPTGYKLQEEIKDSKDKIALCDAIVSALVTQIQKRIEPFDGEMLLEWLIRANEKCIQVREFREILIPARIACFSDFKSEVDKLISKEENLVSTAHALRTLIEWVAIKIPQGTKWANHDDIDELLALTNQLITWGATSEVLRFGLSNPAMGILPSGRIGTEKIMEREILEPYSEAKAVSDVFQYMEKWEENYLPTKHAKAVESTQETQDLDDAFKEEFGLTLTRLSQIIGVLINEGYKNGEGYVKRTENTLKEALMGIEGIAAEEIETAFELLTLISRQEISSTPEGYKSTDIFPWRYTRPLSYLRRPLVKYNKENSSIYFYGYRHLVAYIDNLYFLLYTGKLPERKTKKMRAWIATALNKKGKPFRNEVRDWFTKKTSFQVIDYEVTIKPNGHLKADEPKGDIDVLVIDNDARIIYSVECKNSVGARNIHEMKSEMDLYLGRDGNDEDSKIKKHVERNIWLKANKQTLSKFISDPEAYTIKSFILMADEVPLAYLKREELPLPVKSFVFLRKDGTDYLKDI